MVNQTAFVLTAALAGMAAAGPLKTKVGTTNSSFSLRQVPASGFKPHGALQLAKAYNKFGAKLPEGLAKTVADFHASNNEKRSFGSVETDPEQFDIEYLTPVQIGTPAQTLYLDLDTGSSDLWVFSSDTPSSSLNGQITYKPALSSTAKKVSGDSWSITYGDGSSSSGIVYHDVVSIGGVSYATQAVESATRVSAQFAADPQGDGLIGMAFSVLNTVSPTPERTFFDNVLPQLTARAFTADLKYQAPGTYDFGIVDSTKYNGAISYVNVDSSQGFWGFTAKINGVSVSGIADTGTTLALLPSTVVRSYYSQVSGARLDSTQGGYTFPCTAFLPDFTYTVGSTPITIPGLFMNYAPIDSTGRTCFGGLQPNTGIGLSIYGDIALKAAFVVFDKTSSTPRIGFAQKNL